MADSIEDLQRALDTFVDERDWAQFHTPKNLAMSVAIEAAEIMEHFQWSTGEASYTLTPEKHVEIAHEIADVLLYLMRLAKTLDIDIIAAARDKLTINREKYPVEKIRGRATKYTDLD
jgi:NTP pyrophosphatase (non-canonical NTP hydrolase)